MAAHDTPALARGLAEVQLDVRHGAGRSVTYRLDHVDFLIGSVAGCDWRLPGADLPPVLCLVSRGPEGAFLRKLAPTQLLLVNGETAGNTDLRDGDRITLGACDIYVRVQQAPPQTSADQARARGSNDADLELERQRQELVVQRQELAALQREFQHRHQERRERLAAFEESVSRATRKVQEQKRQLEADLKEFARTKTDVEEREAIVRAASQRLEQERRTFAESQAEVQGDVTAKLRDLQAREERLTADKRELDAGLKRYEADVLRLDRRQGDIERREQEVAARAEAVEAQCAQLRQDSAELEHEAAELNELRARLDEESQRIAKARQEQDAEAAQLAERAAALEGQQATLATLRGRLERMRDDLRRTEQQLDEQRLRQDTVAAEQQRQAQSLVQLKAEVEAERKLCDEERRQVEERSAVLEAAVQQLTRARAQLETEETQLRERAADFAHREKLLAEREGVLDGRLQQLAEAQVRLDAERQTLRERTTALAEAEQARAALQEQLRKRAEELTSRQKTLDEQIQACQAKSDAFAEQREQLEQEHQDALAQVDKRREELDAWAATLEQRQAELAKTEQKHREQGQQLQEIARNIAAQQEALALQQEENQRAWRQRQEAEAAAKVEFDALRLDARRLVQLLPDAELRAGAALDRIGLAREQLRDHVAEVHAFVRQCQDDLDALQTRLQDDALALQRQEQELRRGQDEHRLALVSFKQQLIDWQAQMSGLKRQLSRGENKLERREAEIDDHVRELDAAALRLAEKAENLDTQQRTVAQQRSEMDRHLLDLRAWYRKKLRELAGISVDDVGAQEDHDAAVQDAEAAHDTATASSVDNVDDAIVPTRRDILSITEPMDAGDGKLGTTLRELQLVDNDTLTALLIEARRQRRSLRQVLLASGVVTLYQLALIEAGNIDGLMLGPVRVIDRVRATPHEAVYRVFDPRRGQEAMLRHLAEAEMHDALRPDEFRQRFRQAMLNDVHVASVYEVFELSGRPAVLQEWLTGLPAGDWPPLAAAPGVCYRLLTQAALGLATAHRAGLVHGRLDDGSLVLTASGVVKLCGLGEPAWLTGKPARGAADSSPADDLRALGRIAASWCLPNGVRKGAKTKPLPEPLLSVLHRLTVANDTGYATATELLEDLDHIGSDIPPNAEAWDRLLKYVRDHETPEALLRQTA
jgi:hypothetical protein